MKTPLTDGLKALTKADKVRLHMPGHKGCVTVDGAFDFTEIPGDDNLHDAHGIILEAEQEVAAVYGARESRLLVGGTTAGILAALLAGAREGQTVLVPDCAHKSVFSALLLGRMTPAFIETQLSENWHVHCGITATQVASALDEHPEAVGLILPSPTYYGTVAETSAIAELLHARGKWLIVDEAHGAHLAFSKRLPEDAVSAGADVIVQSTHKMLSGLTQSAVLHINSERIDRERIDLFLRTLQSSSPSYLLMAGIEQAVAEADARGKAVFDAIIDRHDKVLAAQNPAQDVILIGGGDDAQYDKTKWLFGVRDGRGLAIAADWRRRYGIYLEIESPNLLLAYMGIGTTSADLDTLEEAAAAIGAPETAAREPVILTPSFPGKFNQALPLWQAMAADKTCCPIADCAGKIAADMVIPYPPGIPVILPGDRLTDAHVDYLSRALTAGVNVLGVADSKIAVLH